MKGLMFVILLCCMVVTGKAQSLNDSVRMISDSTEKYVDLGTYYDAISDTCKTCEVKQNQYWSKALRYYYQLQDLKGRLEKAMILPDEKKRLQAKYHLKIP